jgi:hypothetical protein
MAGLFCFEKVIFVSHFGLRVFLRFECCVWQTWQRPTLPRLKTKYHRRWGVSRPCSEWERVQPPRHDHQVGKAQHLRSWYSLATAFQGILPLAKTGNTSVLHSRWFSHLRASAAWARFATASGLYWRCPENSLIENFGMPPIQDASPSPVVRRPRGA